MNQIIPPSIAAARGTGVHEGSRVNLRHKVVHGDDLPLSDILDATRDGYVRAFERAGGEVYLPKEDRPARKRLLNEGQEDAIRCARVYRERVAPEVKPVAVEEPFVINVGLSLPLGGIMDYQETARVSDLKTSSKVWPVNRINEEIQPVFYSLVHELERGVRPEFVYHVLIASRGKSGPTSEDHQPLSMTATDAQYRALMAKIQTFLKMVGSGLFPPANPTSWWCGEKWCGYWPTCKYVGN